MGLPPRLRRLPVQRALGRDLPVASTRRARLLGLALLSHATAGPGLLIPGCRSIHTFGMRFPIDVVFLDAGDSEIERRQGVPPFRFVSCRRASAVAELPPRSGGEHAPAGS